MTSDITFVTLFIDLQKIEKTDRRGLSEYMKNAKFIYCLDAPIVFYLEKDNMEYVLEQRKKNGLENKTKIIEIKFEDLPLSKKIVGKYKPIAHENIIKDTNNYKVIQGSKIWIVNEAIKANYFNTNYYSWMDFMINHVCKIVNYQQIFLSSEKIRLAEINHMIKNDIENLEIYYSSYRWAAGCGHFSANVAHMKKFLEIFDSEYDNALSLGYAPLEQEVYGVLYVKYPELFDIFISDYQGLLCNYLEVKTDAWLILKNIKKYKESGQDPRKHIIKLFDSYMTGKITLSREESEELFKEYKLIN